MGGMSRIPDSTPADTGDFDDVDFGMHDPAGNTALATACQAVADVLRAGLGRDVALRVLHGGMFALERDGHRECTDTVVRESIAFILEPACEAAGVEPFTDDEINDVCLHISSRALDAHVAGWAKGVAETTVAQE